VVGSPLAADLVARVSRPVNPNTGQETRATRRSGASADPTHPESAIDSGKFCREIFRPHMNWLGQLFDWLSGRKPRALDNVSPQAQQVLVLARQEADRLYHSFVGTEHLLLGLLLASDGAVALKRVGIDPVELKRIVESALRPGTTTKRAETLPATPRLTKALRVSAQEAELLGHDFLSSEHLVLGLLRLRGGIAWQSLKRFPVTLEHARAEIRFLLSAPPPASSSPAP